MNVYVSLTSIPSRVSRTLETSIQSLIGQDHPIDRIIVTIPTVNMRGLPCDGADVSFLDRYPKVICHRLGYDWGPIMKYVGGLEHIRDDEALVFVCDDDQEYAPSRVSNLVSYWCALKDPRAIVGWVGSGMQSWARALYTVHGVRGVLAPKAALVDLNAALKRIAVPRCCAMNDDVLASIQFARAGYRIVDRSGQNDEFAEAENYEPEDSLHRSYRNRAAKFLDIVRCHWRFNQPFMGLVAATALLFICLLASIVWLI